MDAFRLGFWALHVFNTWLPHGKKHYCYVYGSHHLVESIVILCKKSCLCLLGYYVVQERRDCILNSIVCFVFGVKEVGGIVDAPSQSILEFVEAQQLLRISPNYSFFCNNYKSTNYHIDAFYPTHSMFVYVL